MTLSFNSCIELVSIFFEREDGRSVMELTKGKTGRGGMLLGTNRDCFAFASAAAVQNDDLSIRLREEGKKNIYLKGFTHGN
jgi:hypothetical protein